VTQLSAALASATPESAAAEGPLAELRAIDAALPSDDRYHDEPATARESSDESTAGTMP
jgi:hypothetical protein